MSKKIKRIKLIKTLSVLATATVLGSFASVLSINVDNDLSLNDDTAKKSSVSTNAATTTTSPETISGFSDYSILASSNILPPIVTTSGVVGLSTSKKTLVMTTYGGVLLWKVTFSSLTTVADFYATNYPNQDISQIVVNSFIYLPTNNVIVVLLGTSTYTNQVAVGVNMDTYAMGTLFNPIPSSPNIVKIKDGINRLFANSNEGIIGIKDGDYTDYVSAEYLTFNKTTGVSEISLTIPDNVARSQTDVIYSYTAGGANSNINYVSFISSTANTGTTAYNVYVVAVDNSMTPLLTTAGTVASLDIGTAANITNVTASTNKIKNTQLDADQFYKYPTYTTAFNASIQYFFMVIGGENSLVQYLTYTPSTKTFAKTTAYTAPVGEQAFGFYLYSSQTKNLFISNKKSKTYAATCYISLNSGLTSTTLRCINLETTQENWDSSTYVYSSLIEEFPVLSTSSITVSNPYVILKPGATPQGKYFLNSTEIQTYNLSFAAYEDPVTKFKQLYPSLLRQYASQFTTTTANDKYLTASLTFTPGFSFDVLVMNKVSDDENGVLNFIYKFAYYNWYSPSTFTIYYIPVTIDGFYKSTNFQFSWITGLGSDTALNEKWNQILNLKATKYSTEITKQNVLDYFISYSITSNLGQTVTITEDMITLETSSSGYSLTITINVTGSFPTGCTTSFTQTYDGFKTVSGYNYLFNPNPSNFNKSLSYPSDLTFSIFLEYFISLGEKWSKNENDWTFTIKPDNLTGTAVVSLTYNVNDTNIPDGNKNIVVNQTITGFKNIPSQFKTGASISNYSGGLTPSQLWEEFQTSPTNSKLLNSLTFPYIINKENLIIECLNQDTCNTDGFLSLQVSIKEGTKTSLYIQGYGYFEYDAAAATAFTSILGSTKFDLQWNINQTDSSFEWIDSAGQVINTSSNVLQVNLDSVSYDGINKTMYADQVSPESIDNLFTMTGYQIVDKTVSSDVTQGTLTVVLYLKSSDEINSANGAILSKTIIISGFKIGLSDTVRYTLYSLAAIIGFTAICVLIFLISFWVRRKRVYQYKTIKNISKVKKIK